MTCRDCIHHDVCKDYLIECAEHGEAERILNPCTKFRNKADFMKVKHGYWIGKPIAGYARIKCSVCHTSFAQETGTWKYCPECNAKMDGGKDTNQTRCHKCVNEMECSKHLINCPDYKKDASDGGFYYG